MACSKSFGYQKWSNSVNAQATKCLGLFNLYDGTNRNHFMFDNGKLYKFDSSFDPADLNFASPVTFATDDADLYTAIRIGDYMVFTDRGETDMAKWKQGDANLSKVIASGTDYLFRFIVSFQRRLIGLYSDQTDGNIDIRWSTAWPATAITSLNYPAANQLYVPNDDPITGGATMGQDRCFIYSENSINQLVYYPDYELPFRLFTVVPDQGAVNHHSIVAVGNSHYLFNASYGFCRYDGGNVFPAGGKPISDDIETDIQGINTAFYDLIVGTYIPIDREVCWTVPWGGESAPNRLFFYNVDTGQWRFEDKSMRFVDTWTMFTSYTWNDLINDLGGSGATWGLSNNETWAYYTSNRQRLSYGNTDGHLYYQGGNSVDGSALDGHRVEPVLDFGKPRVNTLVKEVWFDMGITGDYSLDLYHRGGNTLGELLGQSWTSMGSLSLDSAARPVIHVMQNARLHQFKWGTDGAAEDFEVHSLTFKYDQREDV